MIAAFLLVVDQSPTTLTGIAAPLVGAVFAAVTAVLLISDLKRPERFYYLLTKPNLSSWLVWGGVILGVFAAVVGIWFLGGVFGADGLVEAMAWPAIPAAVMTAGYTAFLFGQAEGRDLWQSPVLFWHLQAQALMAGGGALLVVAPFLDTSPSTVAAIGVTFTVATAAHLLMLLVELGGTHSTRNAEVAAHIIVRGRYAKTFWFGSVLLSLVVLAGGLALAHGRLGVARRGRRAACSGATACRTSPCSSKPRKTSRCPRSCDDHAPRVPPGSLARWPRCPGGVRLAHSARPFPTSRRSRHVGRRRAQRCEGAPAQGREALHARADDLLQLRVGLRAAWRTSTGTTSRSRSLREIPAHPGSRGRNCAKGPATVNQVNDPERILTPLRRVGERGSGQFEPVMWDEALDDIAGRIRNGDRPRTAATR